MSDNQLNVITVQQLSEQMQGETPPQLLDCREPGEWGFCRIPGATHIPMRQIPQRYAELDATRPVVVYCHHGMRSQAVTDFLLRQGFVRVANLAGGIDAWSLYVDPAVPRY